MIDWNERNRHVIEHVRANGGVSPSGSRPALLTTTGAKSGKSHTVPLAVMQDGDRIVVFGSVMGAPRNPDWYFNIKANPKVRVEYGAESFETTAQIAEGEERERLWAKAVQTMPIVVQHQEKTTRQIPLVILPRPRGAS
jgi:deazaflavin-dependent oxidoreductase (nitroreductase family)